MESGGSGSSWDEFIGSALLSGWTEPLVRMPWETGFAGMVLSGRGLGLPEAMPRPGPMPPAFTQEVAEEVPKEDGFWDKVALHGSPGDVGSAFFVVAKRASKDKSPKEADKDKRSMMLQKWADITEVYADQCRLGKQIKGLSVVDAVQVVADTFEDKATATLAKRAASMKLFLGWCANAKVPYVPLDEVKVYSYVTYLRSLGLPATRATSFVEALGFTKGLLGFEAIADILESRRVKGAALASYKRKRLTVKRAPLTVAMVSDLERLACEDDEDAFLDSLMAGFCLFVLHGRLRLADGARVDKEPEIDEAEEWDCGGVTYGKGYFETVAADTKTGNLKRRRRVGLPVAGPAYGVTQLPWAKAWLEKRKQWGLDAAADQCLMRAPLASGLLGQGRLNTSDASLWLKRLLSNAGHGHDALKDLGSHSLKATLLSWAAKAGLGGGVRRLLGAHAKPKDNSMLEYSRDAMAGPLAQLDDVLEAVRSGSFDPDGPRSAYWVSPKARDHFRNKVLSSRASAKEPPEAVPVVVEAVDPCHTCCEELSGDVVACACCKKMVHNKWPCLEVCGDCGQGHCCECAIGPLHGCGCDDASAGSGSVTSEDTGDESEDEELASVQLESFREEIEGFEQEDGPKGLVRDDVTRVFHLEVMEGDVRLANCRCGMAVGPCWDTLAAWPKVKGVKCPDCF